MITPQDSTSCNDGQIHTTYADWVSFRHYQFLSFVISDICSLITIIRLIDIILSKLFVILGKHFNAYELQDIKLIYNLHMKSSVYRFQWVFREY